MLNLEVDVAIFANPQRDPRIYNIAFGEHALVLVLCRAHRWAGRKTIRLTDLDDQPMVLREVGSNTRRAFEAACKEANVQPRVMMEIDSREAMREAIAEGIGLGVIGEQALVPDDRLCTLTFSDAKVTLNRHLACLEERRDAPLVRAFLETSAPFLEGLRTAA